MFRFTAMILAIGLFTLASAHTASAATFVVANPGDVFEDLLLHDANAVGGGDSATATTFAPVRSLPGITTGTALPQTVTITGVGFNFRGDTSTDVETVTVTVTYLGANEALGGGDDVVFGSRSATLQYLGTVDLYTAVFDTPLVAEIDAVSNRFRFDIVSTGNIRFKTWTEAQSPSGQFGIKVSVGGTAMEIPEPGSLVLVGLGGLCLLSRHRRRNV